MPTKLVNVAQFLMKSVSRQGIRQFIAAGCGRFCVRMLFRFIDIHNVNDFPSVEFQVIRYKRAVTSPPNGFGAHDGGSFFRCNILQLHGCFLKIIGFHIISITPERSVSPGRVVRIWQCFSSSAQVCEMDVSDAVPGQRFRQNFTVVLRTVP